jgi:antitoxin (DNA-binding transcriptional repressor) of toxin-antitoxin stability system
MWAAVSAKGKLAELVRRAKAGEEEVLLTRHGQPVVRLALIIFPPPQCKLGSTALPRIG